MESPRVLPFTLKYGPPFALGFALFILVSGWQTVYNAFHIHPIVLRGLGGLKLPVVYVEATIIMGASLVLGIGASFMYWMMKNGEGIDGQLSE